MQCQQCEKSETLTEIDTMPFPVQKNLPRAVAEYAHVKDDKIADEIAIMVNAASASLKLPQGTSAQAASMVYLGLCVLRGHSLNGSSSMGQEACAKILQNYDPTSSGGVSINCSFFQEKNGSTSINHLQGVQNACNFYLPRVKSRKKRCFALLVLGAQNAEKLKLPDTDDWLKTFDFHQ